MSAIADIWTTTANIAVGIILLYSGVTKLKDIAGAQIAVLAYRILPRRVSRLFVTLLSWLEVITGILLILGSTIAVSSALTLLVIFTVAAASVMVRGFDIACHCFNSNERISWRTLFRNATFVIALLPNLVNHRPWQSLWYFGVAETSAPIILFGGFPIVLAVLGLAIWRLWVKGTDLLKGVRI